MDRPHWKNIAKEMVPFLCCYLDSFYGINSRLCMYLQTVQHNLKRSKIRDQCSDKDYINLRQEEHILEPQGSYMTNYDLWSYIEPKFHFWFSYDILKLFSIAQELNRVFYWWNSCNDNLSWFERDKFGAIIMFFDKRLSLYP